MSEQEPKDLTHSTKAGANPTDWNGIDRRSARREQRSTLVHITGPEDWGSQSDLTIGRSIDISTSGMRLEVTSDYPFPLLSILGLSISLGSSILEVNGRVIYLQALDEEHYAVGIQFLEVSPEDHQKLKQLVDSGHV